MMTTEPPPYDNLSAVSPGPPHPNLPADPPDTRDEPPPYESRVDTAGPDPDETLDPAVFVLHGRFVYPESASGEPDSAAAYQLSRAIHAPGQRAEDIDLSRIDRRVRTAPDGAPALAARPKDIYLLHHRRAMPHSGLPFQAWLEPRSRKTLGRVELEKSPLFHKGYRAVRAVPDAERRGKEPAKKKGGYCFAVKEHGQGGWQWCDPRGSVVARQVREPASEPGAPAGSAEQAGEVRHRLRVLVPLSRRERDGLVALWCLWMLHVHIEESKPRKSWEDRKRILQYPRKATGVGGVSGIFG